MTDHAAVDRVILDPLLSKHTSRAIISRSSWETTIDDPRGAGAKSTTPARRLDKNPSATLIESGVVNQQRGCGIDRDERGDGPTPKKPSNVSPPLERVPLAQCPKGGDISGRASGTSRGELPRRIRISPINRSVSLDLRVCALIACESATTSSEDRSRSVWGRGGLA